MWTRWVPERIPRRYATAFAWAATVLILSACGAWALQESRGLSETKTKTKTTIATGPRGWASPLTEEDLGLGDEATPEPEARDQIERPEPRPLPLTAARQALTAASESTDQNQEADSAIRPVGYHGHGDPSADGPPAPTLQVSGLPALSPSPTETGSAPPRSVANEPRTLDRGAVSVTGSSTAQPQPPSPPQPMTSAAPIPPMNGGFEPPPAPAIESSPLPSPASAMPAMAMGPPKAWAEARGAASPGLRISLDATASQGGALRYRWVQTQGDPVELSDSSSPSPSLMVPNHGSALSFLLAVSNSYGMDTYNLTIPIDAGGRKLSNTTLKADAGDDQVGVAGRQITLNGIRSEPRGQIGYRWIQIAGPAASLKLEDGFIYSFVPPQPGVYRFGLVVAKGDEISEPDFVTINAVPTTDAAIRQASATRSPSKSAAGAAGNPSAALVSTPRPPSRSLPAVPRSNAEAVTANALRSIDGGAGMMVGEAMAKAFDGIARQLREGRFRHYDEVLADLSRSLDPIVPQEPAVRERWIARVFIPLTAELVASMRPEGLDLEQAEARQARFSPSQRGKLMGLFQDMARGARSVATTAAASSR